MAPSAHEADEADRFTEWVRLHGRAVRGYLLGLVRRPETADDLAQEVFARAWQARARYHEQGAARAYLLRIADRLACDRARRNGRETTLDDPAWKAMEPATPGPGPSEAAAAGETVGQLGAAMERLSPLQRRVLLLRYYGQMSFAEIARTVGCPLNTALSHCHRGLETLRRLLVEETP